MIVPSLGAPQPDVQRAQPHCALGLWCSMQHAACCVTHGHLWMQQCSLLTLVATLSCPSYRCTSQSVLPSKARQFNQFVRPQLTPPQFNQPGSMLMRDATSGQDVTVSVPCSVNPGEGLPAYHRGMLDPQVHQRRAVTKSIS